MTRFVKRNIESFHGPWYPPHERKIPQRISIEIKETIIPYYQLHKFNWTEEEIDDYRRTFSIN